MPSSHNNHHKPKHTERSAPAARPSKYAQTKPAQPSEPIYSKEKFKQAFKQHTHETTLRKTEQRYNADEPMRVSKRMSELGMASRREADYWLEQGWVLVDGVPAVIGQKVLPHQKITLQRAAHTQQATQVTFLLHKPIGYVSGQAEHGYQTAASLIHGSNRFSGCQAPQSFNPNQLKGLAPAGRLDIDSTGLLILTQDGRVAKLLIGEDSPIEKEYLVRVQYIRGKEGERLPESALQKLRHGLELDGKPLKHAFVEWQNEDQLRFILTEGKKRQIRRMCEFVGLKVLGLKRVAIGRVLLRDLPMGQWRYLQPGERFEDRVLRTPTQHAIQSKPIKQINDGY